MKEKKLHNPMSTSDKRIIFFLLFLGFIIYTVVIIASATDFSKGSEHFNADARSGKLLFQKYNCVSCHQVYGLGGYMGPDLTNVISSNGKGPDFVKGLLKYGTNRMPDFHLSDAEVNQLTAYLDYIDKTGISPVKVFTLNLNGTYSNAQK
jgi:nitric oxide reductase subunit C